MEGAARPAVEPPPGQRAPAARGDPHLRDVLDLRPPARAHGAQQAALRAGAPPPAGRLQGGAQDLPHPPQPGLPLHVPVRTRREERVSRAAFH